MKRRDVLGLLLLLTGMVAFAAEEDTYGPIQSGEGMWAIAGKTRPAGAIGHHQMMMALLTANPQAFGKPCNVSTLKVGAILTIPPRPVIESISEAQARQAINEQRCLTPPPATEESTTDAATTAAPDTATHAIIEAAPVDTAAQHITDVASPEIASPPSTPPAALPAAPAVRTVWIPEPSYWWLLAMVPLLLGWLLFYRRQRAAFSEGQTMTLTPPTAASSRTPLQEALNYPHPVPPEYPALSPLPRATTTDRVAFVPPAFEIEPLNYDTPRYTPTFQPVMTVAAEIETDALLLSSDIWDDEVMLAPIVETEMENLLSPDTANSQPDAELPDAFDDQDFELLGNDEPDALDDAALDDVLSPTTPQTPNTDK